MTQVQAVVSKQNQDIFASVFPKSSNRPSTRHVRFQSRPKVDSHAFTSNLKKQCQKVLGVGQDGADSVFVHTAFHPEFARCPPMSRITEPTKQDENAFINTLEEIFSRRNMNYLATTFGQSLTQKMFASAIDETFTDFVAWSYGGGYQSSVIDHLLFWIKHMLLPFISWFETRLQGSNHPPKTFNMVEEYQTWESIALTRLASLRIAELFDIVVDWDSTAPAIDDLRRYTTNPAARSYLTTEFASILSQRLLHPGASTIEILQVYISIIRAFRKLDPRGVLLERVARRIRRYLRDRDDTIKVVVAGLLSDVAESSAQPDPDVLSELALELQQRDDNASKHGDGELDWNNMEWVPDPIDAAPDYMQSKNTDVIGSLISLFESKDIFVKELQTTLADRLLKNKPDFDQEIGVIEHLKIRFGDAPLQGCEVMLRDVLDSRKVDQVIRQDQKMNDKTKRGDNAEQLHTKILSRLFWPSLQEQTFEIPAPIQAQQTKYEAGFESLKQSRKLTWLNAIGQVTIELQLEDRTFNDEVLPWQAAIIYAFQDESSSSSTPITKTTNQLSTDLSMPLILTKSALMYWTSKQILQESPRDTFTVLETLPQETIISPTTNTQSNPHPSSSTTTTTIHNPAAIAAAAEAALALATKEAEESTRKAKMAMYHQFIISMLTNQGAMPLPRVAMILGIVVPGGFPFGNEELREFMGGMVKDGVLEIGAGGNYKVVVGK